MLESAAMSALPDPILDNTPGRVLIVDDEPVVADVLGTLLRREGHEVVTAADGAMVRARIEGDGPWDAILLDVMLPDADGMDVLKWIRTRDADTSVLLITAFGSVGLRCN